MLFKYFGKSQLVTIADGTCYQTDLIVVEYEGEPYDTRFVTLSGAETGLSVIGMDTFSFSCHDFTLKDLEAARHRNEPEKADRKYLYIDYKMRGTE